MLKKIILFLLIVSLFACSGGGGGDDSSSSSSDSDSDSGDIVVGDGVRLLHGVIESEPAALRISGGEIRDMVEFGESSSFFSVDGGAQVFDVFRNANLTNPAASEPETVAENGSFSLVYFGNTQGLGLRANLITNDIPSDIPSDGAAVRFVNTVVGPNAVNVNIAAVGSASIAFGRGSDYFISPSSVITVSVDGIFSNRVIELEAGRANTVLIAGEAGVFVVANPFADN